MCVCVFRYSLLILQLSIKRATGLMYSRIVHREISVFFGSSGQRVCTIFSTEILEIFRPPARSNRPGEKERVKRGRSAEVSQGVQVSRWLIFHTEWVTGCPVVVVVVILHRTARHLYTTLACYYSARFPDLYVHPIE